MNYSAQKAALTRAVKTRDPDKVKRAVVKAVAEWDGGADGYWPDDWSAWQRALDDVLPWNQRLSIDDLRY